jgi:hypothetical protein
MPLPLCRRRDFNHMTPHMLMASNIFQKIPIDLKLFARLLHLDLFSRTHRKKKGYKYLIMIFFKKNS